MSQGRAAEREAFLSPGLALMLPRGFSNQRSWIVKTITTKTREEWCEALLASREETLAVNADGFRFILNDGKVVYQAAQRGMEDLEVPVTVRDNPHNEQGKYGTKPELEDWVDWKPIRTNWFFIPEITDTID